MAIYVHYGSERFDLSRFEKIVNRGTWNKPSGGLWASPVNAELSWQEWCKGEEFRLDRLNTNFLFTLDPTAKVCHLYTGKDLDLLPEQDSGWMGFIPDFEQMVEDGWDAIELHLSSTSKNWEGDGLYWRLYGWDCDSILIMNPDIIRPLAKPKQ